MGTLRFLKLGFSSCKKVTDAGATVLGQRLPQQLLLLNLDFENCGLVTDTGAAALVSQLPWTVTRVAVNLLGTDVSEDKLAVCRHIPTLRSWQSSVPLPSKDMFQRRVSSGNASRADENKSAASQVGGKATAVTGFRLPSVGLRVSPGYGEGLVTEMYPIPSPSGGTDDGKHDAASLQRSSSGSFGRSSAHERRHKRCFENPPPPVLPKWKVHPPQKDVLEPCYPRWVAGSYKAHPESSFSRSKSSPEIRRLAGRRDPAAFL